MDLHDHPWASLSASTTTGSFRAAGPIPVVVEGMLGVVLGHTVVECMTLTHSVVVVLVPRTLAIKEPI
jgi:hypothetical protein